MRGLRQGVCYMNANSKKLWPHCVPFYFENEFSVHFFIGGIIKQAYYIYLITSPLVFFFHFSLHFFTLICYSVKLFSCLIKGQKISKANFKKIYKNPFLWWNEICSEISDHWHITSTKQMKTFCNDIIYFHTHIIKYAVYL